MRAGTSLVRSALLVRAIRDRGASVRTAIRGTPNAVRQQRRACPGGLNRPRSGIWIAVVLGVLALLGLEALTPRSASAQLLPQPSTPPVTIPGPSTSTVTLPPPPPKNDHIPTPPCSVTLSGVFFAFDGSQLTSQGGAVIQTLISTQNLLGRRRRSIRIRIVGHTDSIGSDQYNLGLSVQRADAVRAVFLQAGVAAKRVDASGVGKSQPIVTPPENPLNRRVVVQLLKANGQPECGGNL